MACDSQTVLMLHCNGADASTTFTDSSASGHTVTANGNSQVDTAQSKFGGASALFDGTGDYLSVPDNSDFDLSGGVWTIDLWMRPNLLSATGVIWSFITDNDNYMEIRNNTLGGLEFYVISGGASAVEITTSNGIVLINNWYHLEVVENGDSYVIYLDGTSVGSVSDTSRPANYTGTVKFGASEVASRAFNGWLDEIRVSKGIARHTENFTPPTSEYCSNASNMMLLGVGF